LRVVVAIGGVVGASCGVRWPIVYRLVVVLMGFALLAALTGCFGIVSDGGITAGRAFAPCGVC